MYVPPPAPFRPWLRLELRRSWVEFIIVAALLMALPIRGSTSAALQDSSSHFVQLLLTNRHLLWSIFSESLILAAFLLYLAWRGWKPSDFHIGLGWWTSLQGVGLLLLAYGGALVALTTLVGVVYSLQSPHQTLPAFILSISPHIGRHTIHVGWLPIVVAMVVNAFMEELVCMGYIFNQLAARWGPGLALIITVFLRMACHTYQDPIHLAGIGVLFTIFALWYWRGRKLWPLIFAHILLDLVSVSLIKIMFG